MILLLQLTKNTQWSMFRSSKKHVEEGRKAGSVYSINGRNTSQKGIGNSLRNVHNSWCYSSNNIGQKIASPIIAGQPSKYRKKGEQGLSESLRGGTRWKKSSFEVPAEVMKAGLQRLCGTIFGIKILLKRVFSAFKYLQKSGFIKVTAKYRDYPKKVLRITQLHEILHKHIQYYSSKY